MAFPSHCGCTSGLKPPFTVSHPWLRECQWPDEPTIGRWHLSPTKQGCAPITVNIKFSHTSTFHFRKRKECLEKYENTKSGDKLQAKNDSMINLNPDQRFGWVHPLPVSQVGQQNHPAVDTWGKESLILAQGQRVLIPNDSCKFQVSSSVFTAHWH